MILKKRKIVGNIRFKRIEFAGYGICEKACPAIDKNNYRIRCFSNEIWYACDKIYSSLSIPRLENYCYIYDCRLYT